MSKSTGTNRAVMTLLNKLSNSLLLVALDSTKGFALVIPLFARGSEGRGEKRSPALCP
ncbi:conserved protein of unknown function [Ectopseudomonas oleovorans]|uniref:Uncharacterized protein n=1 Tax=Ectopseudomonas oleovorans TaxID=301 RepID=A0A653BCD3_ECTOL|nr:conserved protein of unknown function [Pseudomonas oleovorans]